MFFSCAVCSVLNSDKETIRNHVAALDQLLPDPTAAAVGLASDAQTFIQALRSNAGFRIKYLEKEEQALAEQAAAEKEAKKKPQQEEDTKQLQREAEDTNTISLY